MTLAQPASFIRRLAALLYESMLLGAIVIALGFALLPLTAAPVAGSSELVRLTPLARAGSFACVFAVCGGYCVWLWADGRRTLAMKAWRLGLETNSGAAPTVSEALLRYLAWWIGPVFAIGTWIILRPYEEQRWAFAALALNYVWAAFDPDHRFLHDRIAGTRIVRA